MDALSGAPPPFVFRGRTFFVAWHGSGAKSRRENDQLRKWLLGTDGPAQAIMNYFASTLTRPRA
jgi:hypothetical protein